MGKKIKITELFCPNCGSSIEINDDLERGECPVCRSKFILEEETQPKGKLDKIIDFFDRQIEKHRNSKKEKELKKEIKEQKDKKSLTLMLLFMVFFMIGIIAFCLLMGNLK